MINIKRVRAGIEQFDHKYLDQYPANQCVCVLYALVTVMSNNLYYTNHIVDIVV